MIGGLLGLGGSLIGNLLSGIFGNSERERALNEWKRQQQDAISQTRQLRDDYFKQVNPFIEGGKGGLNITSNIAQDPTQNYNQIANNYQESPYQKYLERKATQAMNNQLNVAGLTGSSAGRQLSGELASNIASQGFNNYMNSNLGMQNNALGNLFGLTSNALGGYGSLTQGLMNQYGNLFQPGQANYQNQIGGLNNTLNNFGNTAGLLGLYGLNKLFPNFGKVLRG